MRSHRWAWAVGVALGFVALGSVAVPRPARADNALTVEVGGCLSADRLASSLSRVLSGGSLPADVTVNVREVTDGARIEIAEGGTVLGSRTLEAKGIPCEELIEAVALTIAVVVDSRATRTIEEEVPQPSKDIRQPVAVADPARELSDEPVRSTAPPLSPPPDAADARVVRAAVSLEGGVGVGVTPQVGGTTSLMLDVGLGPSVNAGVRPELSLRGGMFVAFPSEDELSTTRVASSVVAPRVDVCGAILGSSLRARACGTLVAGVLLAGVAGEYGRVAAGGRVDGRWMVTPVFGLQAGLDVLANLAPDYVTLDGYASELGSAALSFAGGPVVEFL